MLHERLAGNALLPPVRFLGELVRPLDLPDVCFGIVRTDLAQKFIYALGRFPLRGNEGEPREETASPLRRAGLFDRTDRLLHPSILGGKAPSCGYSVPDGVFWSGPTTRRCLVREQREELVVLDLLSAAEEAELD